MFVSAIPRYFNEVHGLDLPPNQKDYCAIYTYVATIMILCSTWFIVSMTFERFYSIVRPHKAASFNTVKKAKITIVVIFILSILYHIPYFFLFTNEGKICVVYYPTVLLQIYYWMSFVMAYALPSVLLISMNSVIIHTLRKRSNFLISKTEGEGHTEGQGNVSRRAIKQSEKQIYIMLLLVAFSFLTLTTPVYVWLLFINFYQTPPRTTTPQIICSVKLPWRHCTRTTP